MRQETVTIYALCDDGGVVHYVGQTRRPEQRRKAHRRLWPALTLIVLTRTDQEQANAIELSWINHYRAQGCTLRNAVHYRPGGRTSADGEVVKPMTVLLPDDARREVKDLARRTGRKESAMVRRMVMKSLECYRAGDWRGE